MKKYQRKKAERAVLFFFSGLGLLAIFLFQKFDYVAFIIETTGKDPTGYKGIWYFSANKTIRFLLNDTLAVVMVYALFYERKYTVFALWVQLFGFTFILLPYLFIRAYYPEYNGALISHLHRLILNPTLLILLIPAFFYQKQLQKIKAKH